MCDGIFDPTCTFRDPSVLQHPGHLSHEDICAMHAADSGFDQDDVSVPQYDVLTQRQCTMHPATHQLSADSKWTHPMR